jgi:hypothetical protein
VENGHVSESQEQEPVERVHRQINNEIQILEVFHLKNANKITNVYASGRGALTFHVLKIPNNSAHY